MLIEPHHVPGMLRAAELLEKIASTLQALSETPDDGFAVEAEHTRSSARAIRIGLGPLPEDGVVVLTNLRVEGDVLRMDAGVARPDPAEYVNIEINWSGDE